MSPAGTSVSAPMWRNSSVTKAWQKRMISLVAAALGVEVGSRPCRRPCGSVVSAFLKVCSKARNFMIDRFTVG